MKVLLNVSGARASLAKTENLPIAIEWKCTTVRAILQNEQVGFARLLDFTLAQLLSWWVSQTTRCERDLSTKRKGEKKNKATNGHLKAVPQITSKAPNALALQKLHFGAFHINRNGQGESLVKLFTLRYHRISPSARFE